MDSRRSTRAATSASAFFRESGTNAAIRASDSRVVSASAHVPPREVQVWLPPSYRLAAAQDRRYPVLYMHDGQNLFFPERSNFNKVWAADELVKMT